MGFRILISKAEILFFGKYNIKSMEYNIKIQFTKGTIL